MLEVNERAVYKTTVFFITDTEDPNTEYKVTHREYLEWNSIWDSEWYIEDDNGTEISQDSDIGWKIIELASNALKINDL